MSHQSSRFKAVADDDLIKKGDSLFDGNNHVQLPANWLGQTPERLREMRYLLKGVHVIRGYEDAEDDAQES